MSIKHYFMLLIPILLIGCQQETNYIQFKGTLIEKTTSEPVVGCKVQFSDDIQMYGYAITDENGAFDFIVNPPNKNNSYKLLLVWNDSYPAKKIPLTSPLKSIYTYNQFVAYDKTNPYSLATLGQYMFHPTLPGLYTWEQAKKVCNELNAYGHDDWFLPYLTEVQTLACHPELFDDCNILDAPYWTSAISYGGWIFYTNFFDENEKGGVTQNGNQKMHVIPFRYVKL